jgi:anti-sigma regulatory factor (Ser/Thr protein kinase)
MAAIEATRDFAARSEDVPGIVDFVAERAEAAGVGGRRVAHLRIAVEEIALNICNHAYRSGAGMLGVCVQGDQDRFVAELFDEGPPFDPEDAPAPEIDAPVEHRAVGGLGVFLVQRLMDEFRYRREGGRNIVTLVVSSTGADGSGGGSEAMA